MKSILFSLLLFFIPKICLSQTLSPNDLVIFLDSSSVETNNKNYTYLRVIKDYKITKEKYIINDYYKSGVLYMIGASKNRYHLEKEGQYIYYYENGNKKSISNYTNSKSTGKQFEWYENGQNKSEKQFLEGQNGNPVALRINQFWNKDNIHKVIDGNGEYESSEEMNYETGKIKNGIYDGVWKGNSKKFKYSYAENYKNGKFISGISIDSNNIERKHVDKFVEAKPQKGLLHFNKFTEKIFYPSKKNDFLPIEYLQITIEPDGSMTDIKVSRNSILTTDPKVTDIIKKYKGIWIPGKLRGIKTQRLLRFYSYRRLTYRT